jgi:hypothetical protein
MEINSKQLTEHVRGRFVSGACAEGLLMIISIANLKKKPLKMSKQPRGPPTKSSRGFFNDQKQSLQCYYGKQKKLQQH